MLSYFGTFILILSSECQRATPYQYFYVIVPFYALTNCLLLKVLIKDMMTIGQIDPNHSVMHKLSLNTTQLTTYYLLFH
jgi:hypothetical protein